MCCDSGHILASSYYRKNPQQERIGYQKQRKGRLGFDSYFVSCWNSGAFSLLQSMGLLSLKHFPQKYLDHTSNIFYEDDVQYFIFSDLSIAHIKDH
jgi:hypothetical protein